jgi:hypothetical protein
MAALNKAFLILFVLAGVFLILYLLGCEECESGETRCNGQVAQICDGGYWKNVYDCSKFDGTWQCCWDSEFEIYACLFREECE